jgi:hypothetical protein
MSRSARILVNARPYLRVSDSESLGLSDPLFGPKFCASRGRAAGRIVGDRREGNRKF